MATGIYRLGKHIQPKLPLFLQRLGRQVWVNYQGFVLLVATWVGLVPSHYFRRFMYRRIFRMRLGRASIIHWRTHFFAPSGIQIGDYCNIGHHAFLDGRRGITIGNCVATGSEIMIYTLQHDIDSPDFDVVGGPVVIEDYVYIGPRAIILPNVHIGRGAVVAAGAVVTQDIPAYAVVGGTPARFIRERRHDLDYHPDFAMPFQ
jgi:putative colanic acid biosynthesis acetyltransferase WcaF